MLGRMPNGQASGVTDDELLGLVVELEPLVSVLFCRCLLQEAVNMRVGVLPRVVGGAGTE